MRIMNQYYEIDHFEPKEDIRRICKAARICYKSSELKTYEEQCKFVAWLRDKDPDNPHMSPFEHSNLSVIFYTNRGVTHEFVRHRLISPNQESTRYCNYSLDKFNRDITFIRDSAVREADLSKWLDDCEDCESRYFRRLNDGYTPEQARGVLNNDVKAEIYITANWREWRHIFKLRCSKSAHYQFRELLIPLYEEVSKAVPCVFDDIKF